MKRFIFLVYFDNLSLKSIVLLFFVILKQNSIMEGWAVFMLYDLVADIYVCGTTPFIPTISASNEGSKLRAKYHQN